MEEILGSYHPPRDRYRGHAQYLNAAFSESRNRTAANLTFRSLMRQRVLEDHGGFAATPSGIFWWDATWGLTTDWVRGRWRVKLVFMDHDNLYLPAPDLEHFHPDFPLPRPAPPLGLDYIIGHSKPGDAPVSLVDF